MAHIRQAHVNITVEDERIFFNATLNKNTPVEKQWCNPEAFRFFGPGTLISLQTHIADPRIQQSAKILCYQLISSASSRGPCHILYGPQVENLWCNPKLWLDPHAQCITTRRYHSLNVVWTEWLGQRGATLILLGLMWRCLVFLVTSLNKYFNGTYDQKSHSQRNNKYPDHSRRSEVVAPRFRPHNFVTTVRLHSLYWIKRKENLSSTFQQNKTGKTAAQVHKLFLNDVNVGDN